MGDMEASVPLLGRPEGIGQGGESGLVAAIFNLSNTIIGAGLMALPYCFRVLGLFGGTILLLFTQLITDSSLRMLVRGTQLTGEVDLDSLCRACLGKVWGYGLVQACILLNNYGILVVDMIIMGDVLSGNSKVDGLLMQFTNRSGEWWEERWATTGALTVVLLIPLCLMRTMAAQRVSSIIALISPAITFLTMMYRMGTTLHKEGIPKPRLWPDLGQPIQVISTLSVIFTAYMCHYNIHPIFKELRMPTFSRMRTVITVSVSCCTALYFAIAAGGALLFGSDTQSDVLLNFAGERWEDAVVKLSYCCALAFSFPVVFFTLRETITKLAFPSRVRANKGEADALPPVPYTLLTVGLIASQAGLAVLARDIKIVLKLLGALAASCLGYALPGAVAGTIETRPFAKHLARLLVAFAIVAGIIGLSDEGINMIGQFLS